MPTNLFRLGTLALNRMRAAAMQHSISMSRDGVSVGPFDASSPPIGQRLLTETGLAITDQDRTFFFKASEILGALGYPEVGDVIKDNSDGSLWRVLPMGSDFAWNWHGQTREMFAVKCKQEGIPVPPTTPVLGDIESAPITFYDQPIEVTDSITITDPDNVIESATAVVSEDYVQGQDVLAFVDTQNILATWDPGTGTLTLAGTDTVGNYQAALRAITYEDVS